LKVNGGDWNPEQFLERIQERKEEAMVKKKQEQERLKQRILNDWDQHKSINFWQQCFTFVPLKIIRQTFNNVEKLNASGYPVRNKAAFFVSTLKGMGYFPWQENSDGKQLQQNA